MIDFKDENCLNNVLLLDMIKLCSNLIKYDVLRLIGKTDLFSKIIKIIINFFNYDKENKNYTAALIKLKSKIKIILKIRIFFTY